MRLRLKRRLSMWKGMLRFSRWNGSGRYGLDDAIWRGRQEKNVEHTYGVWEFLY